MVNTMVHGTFILLGRKLSIMFLSSLLPIFFNIFSGLYDLINLPTNIFPFSFDKVVYDNDRNI